MLPEDQAAAVSFAATSLPGQRDHELLEVAEWFRNVPDMAEMFASCIRQAIDEVLDGQRTGRFDISHKEEVASTEKTYLGTKVEIIVRAAFRLPRGAKMDYRVAGHDVDAKWTIGSNWTIPLEANGHICLLMSASDRKSKFRIGLVRIRDEHLNLGKNRDGKRSLSTMGRSAIEWLLQDGELPENTLLSLPDADREAVFQSNSGQARINELFCRVQERIVSRSTVLTVARQDDGLKRVRDARRHLRGKGIIILGHQDGHPDIAMSLNLPVPKKGSWVSACVTEVPETSERLKVAIGGRFYSILGRVGDVPAAPSHY
ncbi:NaeI family type II restriction endonuclease [Streptomyces inhibens]|uniref:NaeI family type II restriction endonuclease n=1 Tax=Streptomyces inhibens TaxID=2293571 RepID=UPI001EE6B62F|nr:NaeI family type II restriction endonuclease [Streptomyces inhibens]UKY51130.1 restriction endonuclease [Streptomyces inhibens]